MLPEGIESGRDDAVGKGGAGKGSSHTAWTPGTQGEQGQRQNHLVLRAHMPGAELP